MPRMPNLRDLQIRLGRSVGRVIRVTITAAPGQDRLPTTLRLAPGRYLGREVSMYRQGIIEGPRPNPSLLRRNCQRGSRLAVVRACEQLRWRH
jgi:hypothetical protein